MIEKGKERENASENVIEIATEIITTKAHTKSAAPVVVVTNQATAASKTRQKEAQQQQQRALNAIEYAAEVEHHHALQNHADLAPYPKADLVRLTTNTSKKKNSFFFVIKYFFQY